jgi:hypothetical protein
VACTVSALAVVAASAVAGLPSPVLTWLDRSASADTTRLELRLPMTRRAEILARNRLRLRVQTKPGGRARIVAFLQVGGQRRQLGPQRTVSLAAAHWTDVSLPLSQVGRLALANCPVGHIVVTFNRGSRRRTVARPLRLDPPECARFFGPGSVWNVPLSPSAPLDPDSSAVTADLLRKLDEGVRSGRPATINTLDYAPALYTVDATQPRVPVLLDRPEEAPDLARAFAAVPLPAAARPAPGTDSELVVWQPATDTLWEFWRLRRENGEWHASWGGQLNHVSTGPGHFGPPHPAWGATASSLPLAGGMITPAELRRGRIDHALAMAIPAPRAGKFSLPAQRTDGFSECEHAAPEGARFRLDPSLDVSSLGLEPAVAALARAAQRYGIYVRDRSESVSFYAQSAVSLPTDPYPPLFGGKPAYELLASFPWSHLQLVQMQLRDAPGRGPILAPPTLLGGGCG